MKNLCVLLKIGFIFTVTCSFITTNQTMNPLPYLLGFESIDQWAQEMDPFIKKFNQQAKFIKLTAPEGMQVAEVEKIFSAKLVGAQRFDLKRLSRHFLKLCQRHHFDPRLVLSLIYIESGFNPRAVSPVGARGLMQVMPDTAHFTSAHYNISFNGEDELFNPFLNIELGISYLDYLRNKFEGDLYLTLMAYNMGPFHTKIVELREQSLKEGALNFNKDAGYFESVMEALGNFKNESRHTF